MDADDHIIDVIIETPKESRLKLKRDAVVGDYIVDRILPPGLRFPFNFGFVPRTRAADGDPTDVILVLNERLFPGCRLRCRVLGVIQALQTEGENTMRNDRIVAVALKDPRAPAAMSTLPQEFVSDVGRFFSTYHAAEGNTFTIIGTAAIAKALELIRATTVSP